MWIWFEKRLFFHFNYYKSLLGIETPSRLRWSDARATGTFQLLQIPTRDWNLMFAAFKSSVFRFQLLQIPIRDWNKYKNIWSLLGTDFNYYKSLLGIETKYFVPVTWIFSKFQLLQIPIRDWNQAILAATPNWSYFNYYKSLLGIET